MSFTSEIKHRDLFAPSGTLPKQLAEIKIVLTVLRCPDHLQVDFVHRVRAMSILFPPSSLLFGASS